MLFIEEGKNEEAQKVLDGINGRELRYRSAVAYSYFLYVNALCRQDEHYTEYVRDSIQFYEEGQYHDRWELVYMLMKLDAREEQHHAYLTALIAASISPATFLSNTHSGLFPAP